MTLINWIVLVLAVGVHWRCQALGHGLAMSSSYEENDTRHTRYLNRLEIAIGVAQVAAVLAFISQWIPVGVVRVAGFVALGIAILALVLAHTGFLRYGLRRDDAP